MPCCLACAEADGALDKTRRHKKRQLEDTLNLVLKKRKVSNALPVRLEGFWGLPVLMFKYSICSTKCNQLTLATDRSMRKK